MSQPQTPSQQCAYRNCQEPTCLMPPEGFCIYHSPQNQRNEAFARKVWNEARSRAQAAVHSDFTRWHFPYDPDNVYFRDVHFKGSADFTDAVFQCIPYFDGAVFAGPVKFVRTKFNSSAHFKGAKFRDNACFVLAYFHQSAFFERAHFEGDAVFERAFFGTAASFGREQESCGAVFSKEANFKWVIIKRNAEFCDVEFHGKAMFQFVGFDGNAMFMRANFHSAASFNFASYKTGRVVVFDAPRPDGMPFKDSGQGETAYRLAKQAAYARRDLPLADKYRLWEWQARAARQHGPGSIRYKTGSAWRRALIWMAEKPYRVLAVGLVLILVCWGFYCSGNGVCPAGTSQDEAMAYNTKTHEAFYFSVVTFTTLGYGDLRPKPIVFWRYLAAAEAGLGAIVIASFVVILARRILA